MMTTARLPASFRDPSGFMFTRAGRLYRQINRVYQPHYERLMESGLYHTLVEAGQLIAHRESEAPPAEPATAYKVIEPERVPFIAYPYEWCFSQLQDAALLTLAIQKRALAAGLSLKDSSAYNIQFQHSQPILIDTLSFELYREGQPWDAYRQFCQHFLAPLALMAYTDVRLGQMLKVHIDGLPLDLASRLLPRRTYLNIPLLLHLHLHAASIQRYATRPVGQPASAAPRAFDRTAFLGLLDSLESAIRQLKWQPAQTAWANYYADHNYQPQAFQQKRAVVSQFIERLPSATVWDLGANTGEFSRLASEGGRFTLAFDFDPGAVELNYQQCRTECAQNLLPLVMDLTNPSPALGWQHRERQALTDRAGGGAVLALALIHHLALANNVPLPQLAEFFSALGDWLIIEFVPKADPQAQRLLTMRADIFPDYTPAGFEQAFGAYFTIQAREPVADTDRVVYLLKKL